MRRRRRSHRNLGCRSLLLRRYCCLLFVHFAREKKLICCQSQWRRGLKPCLLLIGLGWVGGSWGWWWWVYAAALYSSKWIVFVISSILPYWRLCSLSSSISFMCVTRRHFSQIQEQFALRELLYLKEILELKNKLNVGSSKSKSHK